MTNGVKKLTAKIATGGLPQYVKDNVSLYIAFVGPPVGLGATFLDNGDLYFTIETDQPIRGRYCVPIIVDIEGQMKLQGVTIVTGQPNRNLTPLEVECSD